MSQNNKVRVGIIGAGAMARLHHLPSLRELPQAQVVAVCDIVPDRARQAAKEFAIPGVYTLYQEMLDKEQLDAVYVLTEPDQIFRPAVTCLRAGKHVFVEKPPGITTYQARTLLQAAREAKRIAMVGLNRRYMPIVQHVVKLVRKHTQINQIDVQFIKHSGCDFYGGCASAFECDTIHILDLLQWLAGGAPKSGCMVQSVADGEACAWNSVVAFEGGVTGTIRANYRTAARVQRLELHGHDASAFLDLGFSDASCSAEVLFYDGAGTHSLTAGGAGKFRRLSLDGKQIAASDDMRVYYGYAAESREFIDCILHEKTPLTDIAEGVKAMELVDFLRKNKAEA